MTFCKGISLKMNIILRQGFTLAYFEAVVHYISFYATWIPPASTKWFGFVNEDLGKIYMFLFITFLLSGFD